MDGSPDFFPHPLPPKLSEDLDSQPALPGLQGAINWNAVGTASACGVGALFFAVCPFDGPVGEAVLGSLAITAASQILSSPQEE